MQVLSQPPQWPIPDDVLGVMVATDVEHRRRGEARGARQLLPYPLVVL